MKCRICKQKIKNEMKCYYYKANVFCSFNCRNKFVREENEKIRKKM